jgi:Flp pilus assembly pilin Flp
LHQAPTEVGDAMTNRSKPSLRRDQRGAAYAEYITLVALVTLVGAFAVVGVGPHLLRTFRFAELVLAMPIP